MDISSLKHLPPGMRPPQKTQIRYLGLSEAVFGKVGDNQAREESNDKPLRTFLLLDAAADRDIYLSMNGFSNDTSCLFDGQTADDLEMVAPWLAEVERDDSLWSWFVEKGYGNNWGIIIHSDLELRRLKTQLKKFLKIEDEDGNEYFFKYFRPENFNPHFPEFTADQRRSFIRGMDCIFAETRNQPAILQRHGANEKGEALLHSIDIDALGTDLFSKLDDNNDDAFWTSPQELDMEDAAEV